MDPPIGGYRRTCAGGDNRGLRIDPGAAPVVEGDTMNHLHLKNVVLLIVILAIAVAAFGGI